MCWSHIVWEHNLVSRVCRVISCRTQLLNISVAVFIQTDNELRFMIDGIPLPVSLSSLCNLHWKTDNWFDRSCCLLLFCHDVRTTHSNWSNFVRLYLRIVNQGVRINSMTLVYTLLGWKKLHYVHANNFEVQAIVMVKTCFVRQQFFRWCDYCLHVSLFIYRSALPILLSYQRRGE